MKKFLIPVVVSASLFVVLLVRPLSAQTDLMQDVDAVKENNDSDLYAGDDESSSSSPTKNTPTAQATAPTPAPAPPEAAATKPSASAQNQNLDDLPVTPESKLGADDLPMTPPPQQALDSLPIDNGDSPQNAKRNQRPNSALTGQFSEDPAELSAIKIYALGDRTRYEIETSKVVDYSPEQSTSRKEFVLNLADTKIGPQVSSSPINSKNYGGPVSQVQALEGNGSNAKVVMQLSSVVSPIIKRAGTRIQIDFMNARKVDQNRSSKSLGSELPDFETLMSLNGKQRFIGTKVNFKSKDAPVPDVLQFISQVSGKNFVLSGETEKRITLNVKGVPWDQVLALVLLNAGLGYQKMGNTYRVMPVATIKAEIAEGLKAQEDEDKSASKATQLFPLSYAKTTDMVGQLQKFLKTEYNETVISDDRTNSVVVTALPKNIQKIRRYIEEIDKQTPVVQVEARIVLAKKEFSRELGIDWAALTKFGSKGALLNIGGLLGNPPPAKSGTTASTTIAGFPAMGANGGLFSKYSNTQGQASIQNLDAVLKLSEGKNLTRDLSRPSLTVLNNKKANIIDGTELTFLIAPESTATTSTTKTVKAFLSLEVTPQVTNDNNVVLDLHITRDSIGASATSSNIPVDRREITTQTLVESGNTVVIGGVYIKEDINATAGWPFLKDLPILGRLFTTTDRKSENERELMIFVSPRILNVERASIYQQSLEEAR